MTLTKLYAFLGLGAMVSLIGLTNALSEKDRITPETGVIVPLYSYAAADSSGEDSLVYPFDDEENSSTPGSDEHAFDLEYPDIVETNVEYDPETGEYTVTELIGGDEFRPPSYYSFEDFLEEESKKSLQDYWMERSQGIGIISGDGVVPELYVGNEFFCRLFGGCNVDIRPSGNIDMTFGGSFQNIENPILPIQQQRQGGFDFDMNINMSVLGKIGEKLKLTTNYNTEATFDFENQVKLEYTGFEDDIVQSIEAGNVSLPLSSTLIPGTQSLFGFKTKLQFGRLSWTSIMSQQRSKTQSIQIQGGARTTDFEVFADEYDVNRHFFLSHYFRDNYENWLSTLPFVNSPVNVSRIEVWVTNTTGATINTRDIVGFADLGEADSTFWRTDRGGTINVITPGGLPNNYANDLYQDLNNSGNARDLNNVVATLTNPGGPFKMQPVRDFEKVRARKLLPNEFTLNTQLGYISVNSSLQPDDILAVSFEYTVNGANFQVGEFTDELPPDVDTSNVIFVKLLKPSSARTDLPIWDLMMKNVYSFGGFQINQADFKLDVLYQDPGGGFKRYIPADNSRVNGRPMISLLRLDNLNNNNDPQPDGIFDFVSGITILPQTGRIIFPVLEPFGDYLRGQFVDGSGNPDPEANNYIYDQLYDQTITIAQQFPQFNRYVMRGSYKSAVSSEIYLGTFNLPRGSVTVTAGGSALTEGADYTVDYNLGRVKIINESILNSGLPVNVNFENNNQFGFQTRTLMGSRFDYWISDNFTLGATVLRLSERPNSQKVNVGDDPIKNRMLGFDVNYSTEAPWLTRALDKLPVYDTKEVSTITLTGEVANFKPGHSRSIDQAGAGIIYIDDFEGSRSAFDLKFPQISWELASTPAGVRNGFDQILFPEAERFNDLEYGKNRALLNWYSIDPLFLRNNSATPDHITEEDQTSNFVREILEQEIFPEADLDPQALFTQLTTFDLSFDPTTPGPYNFDASPGPLSAGLEANGKLRDPESRWAGIQRSLQTNDFEAANIEFIEFWVMDPYVDIVGYPVPTDDGELYINLGNVSEDILKDSRLYFENGLNINGETANLDSTAWGYVPRTQPIVNAFDNDPTTRVNQDKGLDGMNDEEERERYRNYFDFELPAAGVDPGVISEFQNDPGKDNYHYFRGDDYDAAQLPILERYRKYNNPQGNSPVSEGAAFPSSSTNLPNSEDMNRDFSLSETEAYFSYRIPIKPNMTEADEYVVSVVENEETLDNGQVRPYRWLQFKVPIQEYDQKVGNIADFRSIRFVRLFATEFAQPITMRFARLELVRNQWRRYQFSLLNPGEYIPDDASNETEFNVSSVSLEENSDRSPIPYVLPPDAIREQLNAGSSTATFLQNEQALSMEVCPLADGDARAIFKSLNLDVRRYLRLQLDIHAEDLIGSSPAFAPDDGDLTVFLRMGSDFTENFYEIEIPLLISDPNDPDIANIGDNEDTTKRKAIWLNKINLELAKLVETKVSRNNLGISPFVPYENFIPGPGENDWERITLIGNPELGYVEQIMIGVRNPKDDEGIGESYCAELWVNELRLNQIDERGGWAAVARMDVKLADLGSLTLSGSMHTIGFGTLEQQIDQRYKDNYKQYDASINLQLGKFLPSNWGVRLPMYASITESFSTPEFDPYALDVALVPTVDLISDAFGADSAQNYKRSTQNYNSVKSINFTNVRIERDRKGKKSMPWNIENFDFTYAFSRTLFSDPVIEYDEIDRHKGAIAYNYTMKPLYIEPFEKLIGRKSKWLAIIRDINFNPLPNSYGIRTELNRQFGETLLRDIYGDGFSTITFNKYFNWDRFYNLKWDITKSIKFDFSATNNARIDEPFGAIDSQVKKDTILMNMFDWQDQDNNGIFGRNINYRHTAGVNYNVPLKKIPALDWITARAGYDASMNWTAGSLGISDTLGHILGNTQNRSLNGELNFKNLYNKSGFLKKYNSSGGGFKDSGGFGKWGDDSGDDDWGFAEGEDEGKDGKGKKDKKDREEGEISPALNAVADVFVRMLIGLKRVTVNYSQTYATTIPGYMLTPKYLGFSPDGQGPGWDFIAGIQPDNQWFNDAAADGWISSSRSLNQLVNQNYSENLTIKATVEPIRDLRIDLNVDRTFSQNHTEFFRNTAEQGEDPIFQAQNAMDAGSFNITWLTWKTLFNDEVDENNVSALFNQLEENRVIYSELFADVNPFSEGQFSNPDDTSGLNLASFSDGYGPYSQDILIPAFLAAYSGREVSKQKLNVFETMPLPNWRITYNGLSKIEALKKVFQSFSLSHGYTSTLSVNSYRTDLDFGGNYFLYGNVTDTISGSFISLYDIPNVVISEQLAPLIGVDMTLTNDITAKFDYKKTRSLSMNFVDYQLSENNSTEFTIGMGYKITDFQLPFKWRGKKLRLENDLTFKFDMSWRDDIVINYRLDQDLAEPTGGTKSITINPTIDYVVNDRLNIQLFYNRTRNVPKISSSFPVTNTDLGLKVRFSLTE